MHIVDLAMQILQQVRHIHLGVVLRGRPLGRQRTCRLCHVCMRLCIHECPDCVAQLRCLRKILFLHGRVQFRLRVAGEEYTEKLERL